ncbi:MAG: hypothetical protein O3A80_04935 [bacterium]|nr:hypothetical protein [bacterium]
MKNSPLLFFLFALVPTPCAAQEVSFLIEQAYASSEVQVEERDVSELTGAAAKRYRQQLQLQYEQEETQQSSSVESFTEETVTSPPVIIPSSDTSESSAPSTPSTPSIPKPYVAPVELVPVIDQEEQDELTLEQLEEYTNEVSENIEELIEALEEGFMITSTSSIGSPLPSTQRTAILRRNVRTVPQLKLFARALAESNSQLRKIEVIEDTITISFRRKAWILGFIPLNYIFETTVVEDIVKVDKPWWLIFSRNDVDEHVAALQEDIEGLGELEEGVPGMLSRIQKILQTMSDVLQSADF